jgi:hypothetical protein
MNSVAALVTSPHIRRYKAGAGAKIMLSQSFFVSAITTSLLDATAPEIFFEGVRGSKGMPARLLVSS